MTESGRPQATASFGGGAHHPQHEVRTRQGCPLGTSPASGGGDFFLTDMDHRLAALPGIRGYARYTAAVSLA
jgi:hypothetical protein